MTRKKRAEITKKINEFVKNLEKAQTMEELGKLLNQLNEIRADKENHADYVVITKILGNKILDVITREESKERRIIYVFLATALGYALMLHSLDDCIENFNKAMTRNPFDPDA